jgi:hypothetical protein
MKYAFPVAITVLTSVISLMPHAASAATRLGAKVSGLHITASTPSEHHGPRVPRVVRNFNPDQLVRGPKKDIGLARRR